VPFSDAVASAAGFDFFFVSLIAFDIEVLHYPKIHEQCARFGRRRMQCWQSLLAGGLIVSLAGCASLKDQEWVQKTRDATVKTAQAVADATSKSAKRMQAYLAEKDLLKTFQDAGEHSETAVLEVLHKAGIAKTQPPKGAKPPPGTVPPKNPPPGMATPPEHYAGTLRWPLDAGIISSEFGQRHGKMHKGMDIAADTGEPVYACASGEVIYASNGLSGYGNVIILRHDKQMTSLYAHNSELKVHAGDHVTQGALIALLGNTGHSTGPHVHFEIREGDAPINPRTVLPAFKLAETTGPRPHHRVASR
jgi:murein DD-endopeptidase MepM/ murein hydrolase activator NlpD